MAKPSAALLGALTKAPASLSEPLVVNFLPEEQASEPCKAHSPVKTKVSDVRVPVKIEVSDVGVPPEKQEKQALESLHADSLPERNESKFPVGNMLPEKQDSTPLVGSLSPRKHAPAMPVPLESRASKPPGVDILAKEHKCAHALELHGIALPPDKQATEVPIVESSTENQASESSLAERMQHIHKLLPGAVRAEIDTAAPFESVKEAVTLFGEGMDWKKQSRIVDYERKAAPGFDVHKANEEIVYYKELLSSEEASIADILLELEKAKQQIRVCKGEVPIILSNGGTLPPLNQPEEVLNGVPKELHMDVLHELEMARKEIKGVNEELSLLEILKQSAVKECERALSARDAASVKVEELMKEQVSSQEALAAAKAALAETEAHIDLLRSAPSVDKLEGRETSESVLKLGTLKSLELNLSEADTLIGELKEELALIRDVKAKGSLSVSSSEGELTRVKLRLERSKAAEGVCVAALGRALEELDEVKMNLSKATENGASLPPSVAALQARVATRQAELDSAHETEQIACATLASLQDELCSVRALVLAAQASESKAREAKRTLPTAVKQLASEADKAKAASKVAREDLRKGKLELEQVKAAIRTAVSELQAVQKEAEAARASEAMALAEFKALLESESKLGDSDVGSEGGKKAVSISLEAVSISLEEYRALSDAGHEAEEAGNKKVAVSLMQVEEAKASQQGAQAKLDIAIKEVEVFQKAMEQAQKRVDDAQTAKLLVEAELRKWRAEHERWRKTGSTPSSVSMSAAQSPRWNAKLSSQGKVIHHSFQGKTVVGLDSLAEVLSLKVPSSEKAIRNLPQVDGLKNAEKAKKATFFTRVMSIMVRKKSRSVK